MQLHINAKTELTLLKKNNSKILIINSNNYYIKYFLNYQTSLYFNPICRVLDIQSIDDCKNLLNVSNNSSKKFIKNLTSELTDYAVKKISFLGKSYKIKKCRESFSFEFNKAHIEVLV